MLCAVVVGPVSAATSVPTPPPIDPRLLIIGDSVILGAKPWVAALLGAQGWRVNQTSWESMHTWEAATIVDANRSRFGIGKVVIVQLGTNDGMNSTELNTYIDAVMPHLATVYRVYWVNLRQFTSWVPAANATIAAAATRYPNLRIIDWDARSTPDPSLVYADGYHLNPAGQVAMAQLLADTLDGFIRETVAATTTTTPTTLPSTTSSSASTSSTRVSRARPSGGLDPATLLTAGAGGLVVIGLVAMFATRARRKPDSMA